MATKVHQALHGYSDGHRQLASSLSLSPKDSKLVLVMSDVSGPGVSSEGISYLTGYPLPDAGVYAIAQTWPAPEMSRPGCVWTHTFFLGFADLASIDAPSRIARHFRRPNVDGWSQYGQQASIDLEEFVAPAAMDSSKLEWLCRVLSALYGAPQERILARREPSIAVESLVLSAWDQQWPRLRRSFRFCTLTTKDRSIEGATFDLQVAPGLESGTRTRVPGTLEAAEGTLAPTSGWLTSLITDIQAPNSSGLRDSLRMLGADILGGRESMRLLCEFHDIIACNPKASVIDMAVSVVSEPHPLAASQLAKAQVAQLALDHVFDISDDSLRYLIVHLPLIDTARLEEKMQELAMTLWDRQPQKLLAMLQNEEDLNAFASRALRELPVEVLISGWPRISSSLPELLGVRPDLLETASFWATTQFPPSAMGTNGSNLNNEAIIAAMLQGLREESAIASGVQTVGALVVLNGLQEMQMNDIPVSSLQQWIKYSCLNASVVASFLSQVRRPSEQLLELIAEELSPDAVPNDYGDDPWLNALCELRDSRGTLTLRLCAYGFRRALGWRSRSNAALFQLTFEQLHGAVASSALDEVSWSFIEDKLPWTSSDQSWDRCFRLRQTVAKAFVARHLWARDFAWMAKSNEIFSSLLEAVLDQWGGRRFLREVEDSLRGEQDDATAVRRALIHDFLKSHKRAW